MTIVRGQFQKLIAPGLAQAMSQSAQGPANSQQAMQQGLAQMSLAQQQKVLSLSQVQQKMLAQQLGAYGMHPGQFLASPSPPPPPKPEGIPLWVGGRFALYQTDMEVFSLYRTKDWQRVMGWPEPPSRRTLAATLLDLRARDLQVNATDIFGMLLGVRLFLIGNDFKLRSPMRETVWETNQLSVPIWAEDEVVRGVAGIHAAWPPKSLRVRPLIDFGKYHRLAIAEVRGHGKFVKGEEGWRAEKVIIDRVFLPADTWNNKLYRRRLTENYPQVTFEEEPWRLAK